MMTRLLIASLIAGLAFSLLPVSTDAGVMTRACLRSDRATATRSMCLCIQNVANKHLSKSDQRLVASFFKDPHKAQQIRQSDSRSHENFWLRYKDFGGDVADTCGHLR